MLVVGGSPLAASLRGWLSVSVTSAALHLVLIASELITPASVKQCCQTSHAQPLLSLHILCSPAGQMEASEAPMTGVLENSCEDYEATLSNSCSTRRFLWLLGRRAMWKYFAVDRQIGCWWYLEAEGKEPVFRWIDGWLYWSPDGMFKAVFTATHSQQFVSGPLKWRWRESARQLCVIIYETYHNINKKTMEDVKLDCLFWLLVWVEWVDAWNQNTVRMMWLRQSHGHVVPGLLDGT